MLLKSSGKTGIISQPVLSHHCTYHSLYGDSSSLVSYFGVTSYQ
ncbi:hypothetical protein ACFOG5_19335 [Pedobacter fastidiosus]